MRGPEAMSLTLSLLAPRAAEMDMEGVDSFPLGKGQVTAY